MRNEQTALACTGLLALSAIAIVGGAIMNGWALSVMWGWFMVPAFGFPTLSIPAAIGVSMVVAMLTRQTKNSSKEEKSTGAHVAELIATVFLSPLFTLFVGWIVKSFM